MTGRRWRGSSGYAGNWSPRAEAASADAYDDRFGGGFGLDEQLQVAAKRVAELEPQLAALVEELRRTSPALIEEWVAIHQAIYRKL